MIKAVLIEDEPYIRKGLRNMIEILEKDVIIIGECGSVKDAVTVVKACKPDLVFLDINLTDGNAFDFLNHTENLDFKVIFITAFDGYALPALKAGAVDYILKPVDIEELEIAIDKVMKYSVTMQNKQVSIVKDQFLNERLVISLHEGYKVIDLKKLIHCRSNKGYTTFYFSDGGSIMASKPLKYFENKLPDNRFFRTHQSCIVNLDYIDRYEKDGLIYLKGGQEVPVSIRKREEFLTRLLSNS